MGESAVKKVLLDTNFLIDLGRFGVSIDEIDKLLNERHELFVLSGIINELKSIANTQQEESKFAKLALMILDLRKAKNLQSDKTVDEAILDTVSKEKDFLVGTDDVELRHKLHAIGVRCIYFRGKKKLEIG